MDTTCKLLCHRSLEDCRTAHKDKVPFLLVSNKPLHRGIIIRKSPCAATASHNPQQFGIGMMPCVFIMTVMTTTVSTRFSDDSFGNRSNVNHHKLQGFRFKITVSTRSCDDAGLKNGSCRGTHRCLFFGAWGGPVEKMYDKVHVIAVLDWHFQTIFDRTPPSFGALNSGQLKGYVFLCACRHLTEQFLFPWIEGAAWALQYLQFTSKS